MNYNVIMTEENYNNSVRQCQLQLRELEELHKELATLRARRDELLAALHNAHSLIALAIQNCAWGDESTDERDSIDDAKSVLEQARAAIAKARNRRTRLNR